MAEDIVDELRARGDSLSLRAARYIEVKRTTCRLLEDDRHAMAQKSLAAESALDILAFRLGIDLGQATIDKFNEVSKRVGCDVRLPPQRHERRVVGHASGWQEQMDTCVCCQPWPCSHSPTK